MKTDRLPELERRLRVALAAALQLATMRDPAWRKFEASLDHDDNRGIKLQKGMSSLSPDESPDARDR